MEPRLLFALEPVGPAFPLFDPGPGLFARTDRNCTAADAAGNFVTAFIAGSNETDHALYAQRFTADGSPRGVAVVVADVGSFDGLGAVSLRPDGGYVVTWGSWVRVFDAEDHPVTNALPIATQPGGAVMFPSVATDALGNFVVAWEQGPDPRTSHQVFARRFDASGNLLGEPFQVDAPGALLPEVAVAPDGHFAVAWHSTSPAWERDLVRFYAPDGSPLGERTSLSESGPDPQQLLEIESAVDSSGNYLFVWSQRVDGLGGVFGRRFDSAGNPLGGDMHLAPPISFNFDVAVEPGGDALALVWDQRESLEVDRWHRYVRAFDRSGDPQSPASLVRDDTFPGQVTPQSTVAMDADSDVLVTWSQSTVLARRFSSRPIAPAVAGVFVGPTTWADRFSAYLASRGLGSVQYGLSITAADQSKVLPWTGVDRVSIAFDRPVSVSVDDLEIRGTNTGAYALNSDGFSYDPATKTATWTLQSGQTFGNDVVVLRLAAGGPSGVTSESGVALDGEWAGTDAGGYTFPSGNGTAGGDFTFRLNLLPGDVTRSRAVNALDLADVKRRLNSATTANVGAGYSLFADVNGDGRINALDLSGVKQRLNRSLPASQALFALPHERAPSDDEGERRENLFGVLPA